MRPGILIFGVAIALFCAALLYAQKPTATPADPADTPAPVASTMHYWAASGVVLGAAIVMLALLLPRVKIDPKKSPMKEYAQTSASQDDSGFDGPGF